MKDKKDIAIYMAFGALILGLVAVFIPYISLNGIGIGEYKIHISEYDKLGGFIGGITTPFLSISAFILLYRTYQSQKEELSETRAIVQQQQFDTTFFNSLELLGHIIQNISFTLESQDLIYKKEITPSKVYIGRESFKFFYEELSRIYKQQQNNTINSLLEDSHAIDEGNISEQELTNIIRTSYRIFFESNNASLGHYFATVYNIINQIDKSNPKDKAYYLNIIKAQFSTFGHTLLFYNCLSEYGDIRFKPLLIKYSLLNGIDKRHLISPYHESLYPDKAYENYMNK